DSATDKIVNCVTGVFRGRSRNAREKGNQGAAAEAADGGGGAGRDPRCRREAAARAWRGRDPTPGRGGGRRGFAPDGAPPFREPRGPRHSGHRARDGRAGEG